MSIEVVCDDCFTEHRVAESMAGKRLRCQGCGKPLLIRPGGSSVPSSQRRKPGKKTVEPSALSKLAYRIAGAVCCVIALTMLVGSLYFALRKGMGIRGRAFWVLGGVGSAMFFGYIGVMFLITGKPID